MHNFPEGEAEMASIAEASSLFEIDMELDVLLEQIEEQVESEGQASEDFAARFQQFCEAHGEKVDRIGRFVRMMEAREQFCRSEAARLSERARAAAGKVDRTKNMVLYYLLSRDLKSGRRYSHFFLRNFPSPWSRRCKRCDRTPTLSSRLRCGMKMFRGRKCAAVHIFKRRASRSTNDNLRALDYCHLQYHIPTGAEVIAGLAT
jgi:hypothetical protein